jgi:hypothetical protein
MSNIIDSLKRLERIGDENSKTTQKLIEAARELADNIVKQFNVSASETVRLKTSGRTDGEDEEYTRLADYRIQSGQLSFWHPLGYVAENRENALRFSKDIANGLLESFAEILEGRLKDSETALAAMRDAIPKSK